MKVAMPVLTRRRRFVIATAVPYFGFWFFLLLVSPGAYQRAQARYFESLEAGGPLVNSSFRSMVEADQRFDLALTWGVMIPAALFVLWLIARWVYRGRPTQDS